MSSSEVGNVFKLIEVRGLYREHSSILKETSSCCKSHHRIASSIDVESKNMQQAISRETSDCVLQHIRGSSHLVMHIE